MKFPKLYADSYQLGLNIFQRTKNFPKHFRPTLGRRLEEAGMDLTLQLRLASVAPRSRFGGRVDSLRLASERLDDIRIMLQMSHDLAVLTGPAYGELSELTAGVGAQIGGLLKYRDEQPTHDPNL
jgi:hypothetical protein